MSCESPPARVHQDDFSPARGNALQAAVASIFGLALHDVPNFIEAPEGYDESMSAFYRGRTSGGGLCTKIKLERSSSDNGDDYAYRGTSEGDGGNPLDRFVNKICVLRGKSPRGDFGHVVVARYGGRGKFEMMHDPHPEGTYLDESEAFGWCMFFA